MKLTEEMMERSKKFKAEWCDEGDGYGSLISRGCAGAVAYISLPENHPDIDKDYDDLSPDVNGGLTFARGNVFGWDFAHVSNRGTPQGDIKNALAYFKARNKKVEA